VLAKASPHPLQGGLDDLLDGLGAFSKDDGAPLQSCNIEKIRHELIETLGFFDDGARELQSLFALQRVVVVDELRSRSKIAASGVSDRAKRRSRESCEGAPFQSEGHAVARRLDVAGCSPRVR